jgi:hypothetical protein
MTGYMIIEKIIDDLNNKILSIVAESKFPLIFILIGTYPGCSRIHQTPPIICEYIKNDNLSPIIVSFEPNYARNNTSLHFLNKNSKHDISSGQLIIDDIKENTWYYPEFIQQLNASYQGKVAYQYNTIAIDEYNLNKILCSLSQNKGLVFVWNFVGIEFPSILKLPLTKFNIPYASCMANVKFDIEYNRNVKKNDKIQNPNETNQPDVGEEYELVSVTETFSEAIEEFQNLIVEQLDGVISIVKHSRIMFLKALIINSIKNWVECFGILYLWENKVRLLDYRKKVCLNKDSPNDDWEHYKYRSNINDEIEKLKKKFMGSRFYDFIDFLNNEINEQTMLLIKFDSYDYLDSMLTSNYFKININTQFSSLSLNNMKNTNENYDNENYDNENYETDNDYITIDINKEEINNDFNDYYSKKIEAYSYSNNNNINNHGELPSIISSILEKYKTIDYLF